MGRRNGQTIRECDFVDKQALNQMWNQIRQKYGIYVRLLEAIPEDQFFHRPVPDMRTPAEMVAHVSGSIVRDIALGIAKGQITADESSESSVAQSFSTREDVLAFARACWLAADEAVARTGDAQLSAMVTTPWEMTFPGWVGYNILNDELLHHRGQLYAYARMWGAEPPFMWGFKDNAPEFRP